jgi:tRNA (guanine-N7-)-methyltransferase
MQQTANPRSLNSPQKPSETDANNAHPNDAHPSDAHPSDAHPSLSTSPPALKHPGIKSYVRRTGRLTPAQREALDALWPRYGIDAAHVAQGLSDWWQSPVPLTVEIGFGDGDCLSTLAARHPERHYVGFEVHDPGVGHALLMAKRLGLNNLRLLHADAQAILHACFPAQCLDEVLIYFPDPWHKKRHHKRRLVQPEFVRLLAKLCKPNAYVRLATDWAPYAEWMLSVFSGALAFDNIASPGPFTPRPPERPQTKFERRGLRLGQSAWDLCFRRNELPWDADA